LFCCSCCCSARRSGAGTTSPSLPSASSTITGPKPGGGPAGGATKSKSSSALVVAARATGVPRVEGVRATVGERRARLLGRCSSPAAAAAAELGRRFRVRDRTASMVSFAECQWWGLKDRRFCVKTYHPAHEAKLIGVFPNGLLTLGATNEWALDVGHGVGLLWLMLF
jgi:hypothetical protein